MGKIIALLGPHGVGKTTLQDHIESKGEALVMRGFQIPATSNDFDTKEHYLAYQKEYRQRVDDQNAFIKKSLLNGYVIRAIEEIPFFLRMSRFCYIEQEVQDFLKGAIAADRIVYLSATYDTLMKRCNADKQRDMVETKEWYIDSYQAYEAYFRALPNVIIIETDNKTTPEIYAEIKSAL